MRDGTVAARARYDSTMRPRIGITQRLHGRGADARLGLSPAYAAAVETAGARPFLLPHSADAASLLQPLHGLLVPGGADFVPESRYPGVVFDAVDPGQLAFDRAALAAARERDLPVFGICYGMQLMALEAGGALHADLPTDLPGAGEHTHGDADARHAVIVDAGGVLARLLGAGGIEVNSRHHQAVSDPGNGLRVAARAPDGVIEAIEASDGAFSLGVQWHPERMDAAHRQAMFCGFVEACRSPA